MKKIYVRMGVGLLLIALVLASGSTAKGKKKEKKTFDPSGVYHAALGIQTCNTLWITNMSYFDKSQNDLYGTPNARKLVCKDAASGKNKVNEGTFQDVEIKGNGTYTVSLENADFEGETTISQLHIATDIPLNDDVVFSDVSAYVNGAKVAGFAEGYMEEEDNYLQGGMVCLVFNHWRAPLVEQLEQEGLYEEESGFPLLNGTGGEEVAITFTISGFAQDDPDAAGEEVQEISDDPADAGTELDPSDQEQQIQETEDSVSQEQDASAEEPALEEKDSTRGWLALVLIGVLAIISAVAGKRAGNRLNEHTP